MGLEEISSSKTSAFPRILTCIAMTAGQGLPKHSLWKTLNHLKSAGYTGTRIRVNPRQTTPQKLRY
jgi:hypothetical protein